MIFSSYHHSQVPRALSFILCIQAPGPALLLKKSNIWKCNLASSPGSSRFFNVACWKMRGSLVSNVTWVTYPVSRVARCENCAWASHNFKRSSSTWMEDMVPKPSSECSRIPIRNRWLLTASLSWRHANFFVTWCYIPGSPSFLMHVEKIGEPGDEAKCNYLLT